jgi:hypothetical protein
MRRLLAIGRSSSGAYYTPSATRGVSPFASRPHEPGYPEVVEVVSVISTSLKPRPLSRRSPPGCLLNAVGQGEATAPRSTRVAECRRFGEGTVPADPSKHASSRISSKGMVSAAGFSRGLLRRAAYGTTSSEEDSCRREFIPAKLPFYMAGIECGMGVRVA